MLSLLVVPARRTGRVSNAVTCQSMLCARPESAHRTDSGRAKTPEDGCFAALWLRSSARRVLAPGESAHRTDSGRAKTPEDGCFAALWLRSSARRVLAPGESAHRTDSGRAKT